MENVEGQGVGQERGHYFVLEEIVQEPDKELEKALGDDFFSQVYYLLFDFCESFRQLVVYIGYT